MDLITASLAVFAITYVLVYKDGPYNIFRKIRRKLTVFECFPCGSVWIALSISIYIFHVNFFIYWWAIIGISIMLDSLNERLENG